MTVTLPPDLSTLRALVRGELGSSDARLVDRWLVMYADDRVANALAALSIELRETLRDRSLPPEVALLSGAFWEAFERGCAEIDPEPWSSPIDLLRAPTSTALPRQHLRAELRDRSTREIHVRDSARDASSRQLVSCNDLGEVVLLGERAYRCEPHEGRVTFWWVPVGRLDASVLALLEAVRLAVPAGGARALRVTDEFFSL